MCTNYAANTNYMLALVASDRQATYRVPPAGGRITFIQRRDELQSENIQQDICDLVRGEDDVQVAYVHQADIDRVLQYMYAENEVREWMSHRFARVEKCLLNLNYSNPHIRFVLSDRFETTCVMFL